MEFISELDLADFEVDEWTYESQVGILIRVDHYFNFFLGKILQTFGRFSGFSSFSMDIEWTKCFRKLFFTSVCLETHCIRWNIENIGQEVKNLESVLNKFWSAENIKAKDNCVIHDFEEYIFHNRRRYMTKLPFRPIHEFLPNYFLCVNKDLKNWKMFWCQKT